MVDPPSALQGRAKAKLGAVVPAFLCRALPSKSKAAARAPQSSQSQSMFVGNKNNTAIQSHRSLCCSLCRPQRQAKLVRI